MPKKKNPSNRDIYDALELINGKFDANHVLMHGDPQVPDDQGVVGRVIKNTEFRQSLQGGMTWGGKILLGALLLSVGSMFADVGAKLITAFKALGK